MSKFGKGICAHCGKEFEKKSGGHTYCSDECRRGDNRAIRDHVDSALHENGEWAVCEWCGEWFVRPYKSRKPYCSVACKYKAMTQTNERKKKKRKAKPSKAGYKDGFTWDDVRGVLGEFGISSYHKALQILEQRRREKMAVMTDDSERVS